MLSKCCLYFFFFSCLLALSQQSPLYAQQKGKDKIRQILENKTARADTATINRINAFGHLAVNSGRDDVSQLSVKALELSKRIDYQKGMADAWLNLGENLVTTNHNYKALIYLNRALDIYKRLKDNSGLFDVYYYLGWYYGIMEDYKTELSFYNQALKFSSSSTTKADRALIYGNIGTCYEDQNDLVKAEIYYRSMLSESEKLHSPDYIMSALDDIGFVRVKQKRFTEALALARQSRKINESLPQPSHAEREIIEHLTGQALLGLGQVKQAAEHLDRSLAMARQSRDMYEVELNLKSHFKLDSIQKNLIQGSRDLAEYSKLHDSRQSSNYAGLVAYYQSKFEVDKRNAENDLLRRKDERNDTLIMELRASLVVLFLFFVIIAAFFINLRKNNKRTNTLVKLNNQLFSIISHDLRVPFMQVKGLLSLIETDNLSREEFMEFVPQLKEQTDTTLNLLDNMLVWSKNQMQGFTPERVHFEIALLIKENTDLLGYRLAAKNIKINVLAADNLIVHADREMVNIVLRNLLSNAVKFTPDFGQINVSATSYKHREIVVSIADTGMGIKDEDKEKLFKVTNFTREGTNQEKGTGMGLRLCKDLLELNSGSIWMESTDGKGSIFSFSVPSAE